MPRMARLPATPGFNVILYGVEQGKERDRHLIHRVVNAG